MHRPVRNAFLLGVLVGLVVALVRAVRASDHSPAAMGAGAGALPVPRPERAGAPRSSSAPAATARADEPPGTPPSVTPPPAPTDAEGSEPESPADHPSDAADTGHSSGDNSGDEPNLGATAADPALAAETPPDPIVAARPDEATSPAPPAPGTVWVEPVDGGCPEGYPVKAKATSRIFHVVGGLSYERTVPDRCYATAAAAEADGFRAAKR